MRKRYIYVALIFVICATILYIYLGPDLEQKNASEVARQCPQSDINCVQRALTELAKIDGPPEALQTLHQLYLSQPKLRPACFAIALYMGGGIATALPDPKKIELSPETAVCNYGFFQEYPHSFLMHGGEPAAAQTFCERVGYELGKNVPDAEAECFRGIGRGLPFISKQTTGDARAKASQATENCKKLAPRKDDYLNCISGAFNMLARESIGKNFGLSIDTKDPMWLCDAQPKGVLQDRCRGNWKWTVVATLMPLNASALSEEGFADSVPTIQEGYRTLMRTFGDSAAAYADDSIWSSAYAEARKSMAHMSENFNEPIRECGALPATYQKSCVQGFAIGLAKHGVPWQQHKQVLDFCASTIKTLPSVTASGCLKDALIYLRGFYSPKEFEPICATLLERFHLTCDALQDNGA